MTLIKPARPKAMLEAGSAIMIILIAIVLFAALSYTVSQMLRTGNPDDITAEKTKLYTAEIMDTARQFKSAVQNAMIGNNCDDSQISFANNFVSGYEHSPASPDDCQIFHGSEGTASYRAPPADWLDSSQSAETGYGQWHFTGEACVFESGTSDDNCSATGGNADSDLIAIMPWINRQLCVEINDRLGVENTDGDPPKASGSLFPPIDQFTGSYSENYALQSSASGAEALTATPAGCFENNGGYHFYQVLVAR